MWTGTIVRVCRGRAGDIPAGGKWRLDPTKLKKTVAVQECAESTLRACVGPPSATFISVHAVGGIMNKYRFACLAGVVLLGLLLSGMARADSFTYDSIVFTGSVTSTNGTLTIQCTDAKVCGGFYLGDVTLKGFNYAGTPTLVSAPVGYDAVGGGQNNSAVGTGGGCNSNDTSGAVCWYTSLPLSAKLGTILY